jgi:hypothetical protein
MLPRYHRRRIPNPRCRPARAGQQLPLTVSPMSWVSNATSSRPSRPPAAAPDLRAGGCRSGDRACRRGEPRKSNRSTRRQPPTDPRHGASRTKPRKRSTKSGPPPGPPPRRSRRAVAADILPLALACPLLHRFVPIGQSSTPPGLLTRNVGQVSQCRIARKATDGYRSYANAISAPPAGLAGFPIPVHEPHKPPP